MVVLGRRNSRTPRTEVVLRRPSRTSEVVVATLAILPFGVKATNHGHRVVSTLACRHSAVKVLARTRATSRRAGTTPRLP